MARRERSIAAVGNALLNVFEMERLKINTYAECEHHRYETQNQTKNRDSNRSIFFIQCEQNVSHTYIYHTKHLYLFSTI